MTPNENFSVSVHPIIPTVKKWWKLTQIANKIQPPQNCKTTSLLTNRQTNRQMLSHNLTVRRRQWHTARAADRLARSAFADCITRRTLTNNVMHVINSIDVRLGNRSQRLIGYCTSPPHQTRQSIINYVDAVLRYCSAIHLTSATPGAKNWHTSYPYPGGSLDECWFFKVS